jgi:hypothetical protein
VRFAVSRSKFGEEGLQQFAGAGEALDTEDFEISRRRGGRAQEAQAGLAENKDQGFRMCLKNAADQVIGGFRVDAVGFQFCIQSVSEVQPLAFGGEFVECGEPRGVLAIPVAEHVGNKGAAVRANTATGNFPFIEELGGERTRNAQQLCRLARRDFLLIAKNRYGAAGGEMPHQLGNQSKGDRWHGNPLVVHGDRGLGRLFGMMQRSR